MKTQEKPFDPNLKAAMEEIKVVLKKYDAQAAMILNSPTHSEYLFFVNTSWSVARFETREIDNETGGIGLRFRSKKEDFLSRKAQNAATEATVHSLTSTLQFGQMVVRNMESILAQLRKHMKIAYQVWDEKNLS